MSANELGADQALSRRILMVDNYDSFTYNLVHYCQQLAEQVIVKRNDDLTLDEVEALAPSHIIISPGPGNPDQAGLSLAIVERFKGQIPIFGVCLGHQVIGQVFGGKVVRSSQVVHGKTSPIFHNNQGCFQGLPQGFQATRYHSLMLEPGSLAEQLEITAWTPDPPGGPDIIMGIRHRDYDLQGVQFHPESVLSSHGMQLLKQFLL